MIEELKKLHKWRNITPNRVGKVIELYDHFISGNSSKEYLDCKCPGHLRDMFADLKRYMNKNNI